MKILSFLMFVLFSNTVFAAKITKNYECRNEESRVTLRIKYVAPNYFESTINGKQVSHVEVERNGIVNLSVLIQQNTRVYTVKLAPRVLNGEKGSFFNVPYWVDHTNNLVDGYGNSEWCIIQ